METTSIMIVGVGGQGTLLAGKILGRLLMQRGYDVKVSEVHGMSQRGGSVVTHVRFGTRVRSPIVDVGGADYMVSFELMEAARWMRYVKQGGVLLTALWQINPMPVVTGAAHYPGDLVQKMAGAGVSVTALDALTLAAEAGSERAVNLVLLGRLSRFFDFPLSDWQEAIKNSVPERTLTINQTAFLLGRDATGQKV